MGWPWGCRRRPRVACCARSRGGSRAGRREGVSSPRHGGVQGLKRGRRRGRLDAMGTLGGALAELGQEVVQALAAVTAAAAGVRRVLGLVVSDAQALTAGVSALRNGRGASKRCGAERHCGQ